MPNNCKLYNVCDISIYSLLKCDTMLFVRQVTVFWGILLHPVCRYKSKAAPTAWRPVPIYLTTLCHNSEAIILHSHHCEKPQISCSTYSIYSIDGNHPQYPEMKYYINCIKSATYRVHASHVSLCCDLCLCFLEMPKTCAEPITGRKP